MKIAIDVSQMCYEGTGVARYVHGLTESLLEAGSEHEFLLFAGTLRRRPFFTNLKQSVPWNSAEWVILPLPPKVAGLALNTLNIPIEKLIGYADLFHCSDWVEPSSICPRVTTVHDLVFVKYPDTVDILIRETQIKRLKKIVAGNTNIIADSMSTKNDLMERYGLPTSRIDVIYPGISPAYLPQSESEIDRVKTKYHLPKDFILSLGTQEPRKNITRLIEATRDLTIPLVLTGKYGWGVAKETADKHVLSTGYVEEIDLPALYSGAIVFAYPSLYEGFGFPVLEAMACGTPVVTSNISSLPEVAGDAAILVNPNDVDSIKSGIEMAIKNRDDLIKKGLTQSEKFSWSKCAKQVLEVYEKITNRS